MQRGNEPADRKKLEKEGLNGSYRIRSYKCYRDDWS